MNNRIGRGDIDQTRWKWPSGWRAGLSRLATIGLFLFLTYWGWLHRHTLQNILTDFELEVLLGLCLVLTLGVALATWGFTMLVRSMGYRFTYRDGYHSLNVSQIAALMPGKIWGYASLAGLLWSRGVSRPDSVLLILLHTLLSLSAAALIGISGLVPLLGWGYALLCLAPLLLLLAGRSRWEALRARCFRGSSALPSLRQLLMILVPGLGSWIAVSGSFTFLVYSFASPPDTMAPWFPASAFAAGYIGGFVNPIIPAGLGVREGIITAVLGPTLGSEQVLALALVFRVFHTAILWLHSAISLSVLSFGRRRVARGDEPTPQTMQHTVHHG